MSIIVFQHSAVVGPGRVGATLRDHGFDLDVRRLDLPADDPRNPRAHVPRDFDNVHGVVALGGPQNLGENHPWMDAEIAYLREAHRRQIPLVGVCLGSQMIAAALGGKVAPLSARRALPELGFHRVSLNPSGQTDTLFAGIAWDSMQYCSHAYEVTDLPADATLLASSMGCRVQAWRAGLRTVAVQYHPELDRAMIDQLVRVDEPDLRKVGLSASDVRAQCDRDYDSFARMADRWCVNLATYLFPLARRLSA